MFLCSFSSYVHVLVLYNFVLCVLFFFFKQKTAYEMRISDWSSDVCSSDLRATGGRGTARTTVAAGAVHSRRRASDTVAIRLNIRWSGRNFRSSSTESAIDRKSVV